MPPERPHSRHIYPRERTSALTWLVSAIVAAFALQLVLGSRWMHGEQPVYQGLALSVPGLAAGQIWTLLTHAFLHRPGFIFHPIGNVLLLYFLGRELGPMLGNRRFFGLLAAATVAGGLVWAAVHWRVGGDEMLIGATTPVYALGILFACFFPQREINFLLFFIVPVTLKPRQMAIALIGFDAFGLLLYEMPGASLPLGISIAHSAHLGGALVGYLYYQYVHGEQWSAGRRRSLAELPRPSRLARKPVLVATVPVEAPLPAIDIRVEVDRILDKINSDGLASLTAEEKRVLDEAKDAIPRR